ncbi:MAG: DUF1569 domain-containing protein [Phycisphaerales bacterium]
MIDTKNAECRKLHFQSIPELRAEVERLLAADRKGMLKTHGNWTAGQILGHCASWIDWGYVGYPAEMNNPPWFIKLAGRIMKKHMMTKPMRKGIRMPRVAAGTYGTEKFETQEGGKRLLAALSKLEAGPPKFPSPMMGVLTQREATMMHLRHCELHLGFLDAE